MNISSNTIELVDKVTAPNTTQDLNLRPLNLDELTFAEVWAASSTMVGITSVAVLGNLAAFLLTTFCRTRSHFHSICIANLALADLAVGLFVPLHWIFFLRAVPPFHLPCSTIYLLQTAMASLQTISVASVTLITLDRVCITLWPVRYHNRNHQTVPILAVTSIWVLGPVPHVLIFLANQSEQCSAGLSVFVNQSSVKYLIVAEFFLPLFLLVASNTAIYYKVSNRQKPFSRGQPSSFSKSSACHEHAPPPTPHDPMSLAPAAVTTGYECTSPTIHSPPPLYGTQRHESNSSFHYLLMRRRSTSTSNQLGFSGVPSGTTGIFTYPATSSRRSSIQTALQVLMDLRRSFGSLSLAGGQKDQDALVHQILRKQHRRTLKLLVLLVMLFLLCRGPRAIFLALLPLFDTESLRMDRYILWVNLIVQLNAALDPLAYSFWGNRLYKRRVGKRLDQIIRHLRHWKPIG